MHIIPLQILFFIIIYAYTLFNNKYSILAFLKYRHKRKYAFGPCKKEKWVLISVLRKKPLVSRRVILGLDLGWAQLF